MIGDLPGGRPEAASGAGRCALRLPRGSCPPRGLAGLLFLLLIPFVAACPGGSGPSTAADPYIAQAETEEEREALIEARDEIDEEMREALAEMDAEIERLERENEELRARLREGR